MVHNSINLLFLNKHTKPAPMHHVPNHSYYYLQYCIDVINELSDNSLVNIDKLNLYDKDGCIVYDLNVYVKGSGIVNGTEFILI